MSTVIVQDYDTLCQAVADQIDRADLADRIPGWVHLGHQRVSRDVSRKLLKTSLTINAAEVVVPAGVSSVDTLVLVSGEPGKDKPLEPVTVAMVLEHRAGRANVAGRPTKFAVRPEGAGAGTMMFAPSPDQSYTASLVYVPGLPAPASSNPTNVVLQDAPDLYFYATLVHASLWMKDGEAGMWDGLYQEAIKSLRIMEQREQFPGGFPAARLGRVF